MKESKFPVEHENLKPAQFIKMCQHEKGNIKSAKFIPPVPGSGGFGRFHIEYKKPVLRSKTWSPFN